VSIEDGVPGPVQLVSETSQLNAVACSSPTSCVAVGADGVLVPIDSGVAGPADVVPGVDTFWNVSCGGPASCFATATSTAGEGLVVPVTGGVAGPAQTVAGVLTDVIACQSESSCLATAFDSSFHSYIVSITGGTAGPPQPISQTRTGFVSIGCTDASHCVAVGDTHGQCDPPPRERARAGPHGPRRWLGPERHRKLPLTARSKLGGRRPTVRQPNRRAGGGAEH
jgi:hypothetical protein